VQLKQTELAEYKMIAALLRNQIKTPEQFSLFLAQNPIVQQSEQEHVVGISRSYLNGCRVAGRARLLFKENLNS
jgi:hypothetical protein